MSRGFWTAIGGIVGSFAGMGVAGLTVAVLVRLNCCPGVVFIGLLGPLVGLVVGALLGRRFAGRRRGDHGGAGS